MRICMVISNPFPPEEGIGYHVYNITKKLNERGHKVTILTRGTSKLEKDIFEGIDIIKIPFFPLYPFHVHIHGYFMERYLKENELNFDLIHIHTPLTPVFDLNIPIVSTIHTSVAEDAKHIEVVDLKSFFTLFVTKMISQPLISKLIAKSTIVTTVSQSVTDELEEFYNFKDARITGNGVETKTFIPAEIREETESILYVGRLSYRKGLFELLESAKKICDEYDVKFLLVGKGELEERIKKIIKNNGLQEKIILLGHVNQEKLIHLYQHSKIYLMPSYYESGPLVLLEAMSCGAPVISTKVGIATEAITDNYNGILISCQSHEEISESIRKLLNNNELREKLRINTRKTMIDKYSWEEVVNRLEECYSQASGKIGN